MAQPVTLAIDQDTTSTRAIVFDRNGTPRGSDLPLPVWRRIAIVPTPSALSSTIRARHTCFCGLFPDPTTVSSRSRSPGPSRTSRLSSFGVRAAECLNRGRTAPGRQSA